MTLSLVGNQIVGDGSAQIPCGQFFTVGTSAVVSGTVAQNGSFTAQNSATQLPQALSLQMSGIVPASDGNLWTGTYSFSSDESNCPFSSSGPIAAVRIADLTGTYTGSGTLTPSSGTTGVSSQPVSLTFTLQQGQTTLGAQGTQQVNEAILNGSVQVQGTSCFSTGQIVQAQPPLQGNILGPKVLATFTMDDGSHLALSANIEDTLASKLLVVSLLPNGGKCDGQFIGSFEASRQ